MSSTFQKHQKRRSKASSLRGKLRQVTNRPRLSVFRSLSNISVQIIDDLRGEVGRHGREISRSTNAEALVQRGKADPRARRVRMDLSDQKDPQLDRGVGHVVQELGRDRQIVRATVNARAAKPNDVGDLGDVVVATPEPEGDPLAVPGAVARHLGH